MRIDKIDRFRRSPTCATGMFVLVIWAIVGWAPHILSVWNIHAVYG